MANDLRQQLQRINVKSQMLAEKYRSIAEQKRLADERIAELEQELSLKREELAQMHRQIEYLQASRALVSADAGDIAQTRALLNQILREIDKCIEQLTY